MSSISRTRLLAAAATTVLAALSLTACNNGTGAQDEGRAAGPSPSGTASHSPAPSAATDQSPSTDSTGSSTGTGSAGAGAGSTGGSATSARRTAVSKAPSSSGGPVTCEGSTVRTVAAPLTRPVNHMLLTVTNTGSKSCYLYGYPLVRFGEAQAVPPVIEASQPQAVVTLGPGESGYASVNLAATDGSGANGYTAKTLTVYFQGRSGNGSVGKGAHPSLPAQGTYVDDALKVTYWQQSMDDAVTW
ncbi:DUF4232 domain-containing protein [Streptomyces sviceus]|uniref:DUF4232 domain-containing protein n=1 Tax=Streptomyces sviceus TaxID=285530 RepID=UPI0036AFDB67